MNHGSSRLRIVHCVLFAVVAAISARGAEHGDEPVRASHGMVASVSEIASRVGVEIMQRGGNAVDAAVAVGLARAVGWPSAGNWGGGGCMLSRRADGTCQAIGYTDAP